MIWSFLPSRTARIQTFETQAFEREIKFLKAFGSSLDVISTGKPSAERLHVSLGLKIEPEDAFALLSTFPPFSEGNPHCPLPFKATYDARTIELKDSRRKIVEVRGLGKSTPTLPILLYHYALALAGSPS